MDNRLKIPNIFHFINIGPRHFNLMHFLSIISAYELNRPDKIYVYCTQKQYNEIFWDILDGIVTFEFIDDMPEYKGVKLNSYQYKADVIRMEKLIERGGVYMDLDILSLKPVTSFFNKNIVVGGESHGNNAGNSLDSVGSVANGVLISEPNNPFLKEWLERIPHNIIGKPWAYHAVNLPKNILAEGNHKIHLEPTDSFFPFCFRKHYIFKDDMKDHITNLTNSYTIHLWETIWHDEYISKLSVKYFNEHDNILTWMFGKYLKFIYDHRERLDELIERAKSYQWNKLLSKYSEMYIELCKRYGDNINIKYPYYKLISTYELKDFAGNNEAYNFIKESYKNIPPEYQLDNFKLQ